MLRILQNILQSISKFIKFLQEKIMPIFNISKVGSVNSGSDVISKVYAGPNLVYSAVPPNGYLFRDFDPATGVLSAATGELEDASEITEIPDYGLYYGFNGCTGITSVSFPNLTSVGSYGMSNCFQSCTGITSISFPSLTSIGENGMYECFYYCTGLVGKIEFPELTSVGLNGMYNCFYRTGVTEVHFKASLSGNSECTADRLGITGNVYFDL